MALVNRSLANFFKKLLYHFEKYGIKNKTPQIHSQFLQKKTFPTMRKKKTLGLNNPCHDS